MASRLNSDSSNGLQLISDSSGELQFQSSGITKATLNSSGLSSPGHVLQVVQSTKTDTFSSSSTSYTDVTGLSASITPSSTSSKILVLVNFNASVTATDNWHAYQILRGATAIHIGDTASSRTVASVGTALLTATGSNNVIENFSIGYLDSPSTTSATTYKLQGKVQSGQSFVINRSDLDADATYGIRTSSSIILMEVAG
jgi:hypothetical protein